MKSIPSALWFLAAVCTPLLRADDHVAVVASSDHAYERTKFGEGAAPRRETYVVMRGRFFPGVTVDPSIDKMPFKDILGYLAPRLSQQQYWPAKTVESADLMLVVHWGVTNPRAPLLMNATPLANVTSDSNVTPYPTSESVQSATHPGGTPDVTMRDTFSQISAVGPDNLTTVQDAWMDNLENLSAQVSADRNARDVAQLLGYSEALARCASASMVSETERTLRHDLETERYFISVRAYEMHPKKKQSPPRPVWKINLNISSPGNNFRMALQRMSTAAVSYIGRTSNNVETLTPRVLEGKVELGETIILGEVQ